MGLNGIMLGVGRRSGVFTIFYYYARVRVTEVFALWFFFIQYICFSFLAMGYISQLIGRKRKKSNYIIFQLKTSSANNCQKDKFYTPYVGTEALPSLAPPISASLPCTPVSNSTDPTPHSTWTHIMVFFLNSMSSHLLLTLPWMTFLCSSPDKLLSSFNTQFNIIFSLKLSSNLQAELVFLFHRSHTIKKKKTITLQ